MRIFLLLLLVSCLSVLAKAQLDFQRSLSYSFDAVTANPALLQDHRVSIRIGSSMQSASANFELNDIGTERDENFLLQGSRLAANAPETLELSTRFDIATLGFNIRRDRFQFGAHHAIRFEATSNVNRELALVLAQGNQASAGEVIPVLIEGEQISYHEFGFHYGIHLNQKFAIGGRVKVLSGSAAAQINSANGSIRTDPNSFAIDYNLSVDAQSAGYNFDLTDEDFSIAIQPFTLDKGFGGAVDLGVVVRPSRKLELSLALTDLGAIRWSTDAKEHFVNGEGTYVGVIGNVFDSTFSFDIENSLDQLQNQANLSSVDQAFTMRLSPKLQGHLRYRLSDATDLTLAAQTRSLDGIDGLQSGASVGIGQHFGDFLHVGGIVGVNQGEFIYGGRASVMLLGIQVFAAADHLPSFFNLYGTKSAHLRVGLSLNFNRIELAGKRYGWFDDELSTGRTTPDNYL